MNEADGLFYLSMATLLTGFTLKLFSICLKSKCEDCNICFGLLNVHRNVVIEEKETEFLRTYPKIKDNENV
jgi:translation elongation factor EF-1beta